MAYFGVMGLFQDAVGDCYHAGSALFTNLVLAENLAGTLLLAWIVPWRACAP